MTRIMHPVHKGNSTTADGFPPRSVLVTIGAIFVALVLYVGNFTNQANTSGDPVADVKMMGTAGDGAAIVTGSVGDVAYYHCSAAAATTTTTASSDRVRHLVLLHGSKFTKEDWKTSGILQSFCTVPNLSVTAVDLPVTATHTELVRLLDVMADEGLIMALPVSALVTPSASGKTVTDWITNGDVSTLPTYLERWIPIASGSVSNVPDDRWTELASVMTAGGDGGHDNNNDSRSFGILAVHGNKDVAGKRTTEILRDRTGAATVELRGGHPCYLDSPEDFVSAVASDMGLLLKRS
jgi:hypothetical protein